MAAKRRIEVDDYFLSPINPTATADQRDLEALCVRVAQMAEVQDGTKRMAQRWRTIAGRDITAEAETRFDELVEEFAFNYIMKAANSDPNHPRIMHHLYGPPHEWFGLKVPGSRGSGGDGPDQSYCFFPVDGRSRFELQGRVLDPQIGDVPFILAGNLSLTMTLGRLGWNEVDIGEDGSFVITLDPLPANGRRNHIRLPLESRYVFIRDCRADWRQTPCAYRLRRLDPPTAPPLAIEEIADRAVRYMWDDVPAMYWYMRTFAALEPNVVTQPFHTGNIAGLVQQLISFVRLELKDDEAYVVTFEPGGSPFRDLVVHDFWFRTIDYWKRQSSLNIGQAVENSDGTTTYVISIADPGVHNWVDACGFHQLLVVHRWQAMKRAPKEGEAPWAVGKLVKLCDLDAALPPRTKRVDADERRRQLADRRDSFFTRYAL